MSANINAKARCSKSKNLRFAMALAASLASTTIASQCLAAGRTRMVFNESDYVASWLFSALVSRVWLSEYTGMPTDVISFFYCPDPRPKVPLDSDVGNATQVQPIEVNPNPSIGGGFNWSYRCTPVRNLGLHLNEHGELEVSIAIVDFDRREKVIPAVQEVIRSGTLGKYAISSERAVRLIDHYVKLFGVSPGSTLSTFPSFESFFSGDTTFRKHKSYSEALKVLRNSKLMQNGVQVKAENKSIIVRFALRTGANRN